MRLLFVIDSPATLNPQKDSTIALINAAHRRGDIVHIATLDGLSIKDNRVLVSTLCLSISDNRQQWFDTSQAVITYSDDFDLILMRKEPPVDDDFITATRLLDLAAKATPVVNTPAALQSTNEKLAIFNFPEWILPTWVGNNIGQATDFYQQYKKVVLKPLDGMGGQGVYIAEATDLNFNAVFDLISHQGQHSIMIQQYSPAADDGDYRLFVVAGQPLPWVLKRVHADNDYRNNMAAGGKGIATPLDNHHRDLVNAIGPTLQAKGIVFAGLDVIGGHLIEINITCPTGLCQINEQADPMIADTVLNGIINSCC